MRPSFEERKSRVRALISIAAITMGAWLVEAARNGSPLTEVLLKGPIGAQVSLFLGGPLMLFGASMLLLLYLRGDLPFVGRWANRWVFPFSVSLDRSDGSMGDDLAERVRSLDATVADIKKAQVSASSGSREDVIVSLLPLVQSGVGEALEQKFAQHSRDFEKLVQIRHVFDDASARLRLELASLRNRGNLNLVIGTMTTAIAIALLTYMVLGSDRTFQDVTELLSHYVPRVTIVVFIEIFAFFFLKLYRETLGEMRTYQSELTRLNVQRITIEAAWTDEAPNARKSFAETLLRADQSGIGKQKAQPDVDLKAVASLVEKLSALVPGKGKPPKG